MDAHNKAIIGKGGVWYEMSYEDAIKEKMQTEAGPKCVAEERKSDEEDDDDDSDDDDYIYSILSNESISSNNQPVVNGTESSRLSEEGMFED